MSEGVVLNPTRLVLAALIGLVILLVLIIKFNVQAMIAILIGAISIDRRCRNVDRKTFKERARSGYAAESGCGGPLQSDGPGGLHGGDPPV